MRNILIIDDDAGIRNVYKNLLQDEGFSVWTAADAKSTAGVIFTEAIDLILLDINLPDFGGEMMFDVIRDSNPSAKIIISSVYPVEQQKKWIRGAAGYFDKAQGPRAMLQLIQSVLSQNQHEHK